VSLDNINTLHVVRNSYGSDAAEPDGCCPALALAGNNADDADDAYDQQDEIATALCSQLDRVLDELWSFGNEQTAFAADSVALAQLALRLCCLYPQPAPAVKQRVTLGARVLELNGRDALLERSRVRMTRREAELLHYLLSHRERIVSREELMEEVWEKRLTGAAARTVDIHVHRLRRKLGNEFAERLETVRNVGYKFSLLPPAPEGLKQILKRPKQSELQELATQ